jgi:alpha-ribazole phosphatase
MRLALVRHPQPDIAPGICYGRLDIPLRSDTTETVREIASNLVRLKPARVWTSPAIRCRLLAETVATAAGVTLRIDPRLQELNFGTWEGCNWNDVPRAALDVWAADPHGFAPPQGETGSALIARIQAVYEAIRAAGENCAIISHGGPLKLLAAMISGQTPDLLASAPPIGSVQVFAGCHPLSAS